MTLNNDSNQNLEDSVKLEDEGSLISRGSPFIQLKSFFKGYENHLTEVVLSERLLDILGYTTDSFASAVLAEGLPQ